MKKTSDFKDYSVNLLLEAISQKEIPLIFSDNFRDLIRKIQHPISDRLLNSEKDTEGTKSSFVDLDNSGLDKISFITSTKAAEVVADYKNKNKETDDINFPIGIYLDIRYNDKLSDLMYSKFRSVTSIGKLISKLFSKEFEAGGKPGEDIQSFTDKFKSLRSPKELELVKGSDIVKYYNENNYVDYVGGSLENSCMKYSECSDYVQFYADNPDKVSLLVLKDSEEGNNYGKVKGRALVWKLSEPKDRIFMDRIYTTDGYDEELFKSYAKKNGWLYKYRQNSSNGEYIVDTKDDSKNQLILEVDGMKQSSTDNFPYVDTIKYYFPNEKLLSSNFRRSGYKLTLQDTNGNYDEYEDDEDDDDYYDDYDD